MTGKFLRAMCLAAAFATPAAALDFNQDYDYSRGAPAFDDARRLHNAPPVPCDWREKTRADLGGGWSLGLGGGLKDPTVKLRWQRSLQPHLEQARPRRSCALLDLRR